MEETHRLPVVVMGVSGSGKTTIGRRIADALGRTFVDADNLHSPENRRKMASGIPLDDRDRAPWLASVGRILAATGSPVVACSALRRDYREVLRQAAGELGIIYLYGDSATIGARLQGRRHDFMPPDLLPTQFSTLEEPFDEPLVLTLDISRPPAEIAETAAEWIRRTESTIPVHQDVRASHPPHLKQPRIPASAPTAAQTNRSPQMKFGIIGAGRMGANIARRATSAGHECIAFDTDPGALSALRGSGCQTADNLPDLVQRLPEPRVVWLMVPAAATDAALDQLRPLLAPGDTVIDGGNSHFREAIRRSRSLALDGVDLVDVGTSGGVHGLARGYCLMVGGSESAFQFLEPLFAALAPGLGESARTPGLTGPAATEELGYLHCGPSGAGHFVKMVHNGIEYGMMAAMAEGFNLLAHANAGANESRASAEVAPISEKDRYLFNFDLARIAQVWRRGSVVSSWLLDLTASALAENPGLHGLAGRVSDSGEGRWAVQSAIDVGVPTPVLSASLYSRFASRDEGLVANQILSAMRMQFGGHEELGGHDGPGSDTASTA